ncbi:hypothetical protein [Sulfurimonas autotrophica]|uniref:GGDEF domain-containing protein n=1 Tax=Sulfurimonas autotrophica (strain ATCC BAA-671 / DSM 16294 / JCM 11897 / OK10) TaxID=563040 RepID=E0UTY6_SULAO|nr:hypothetical protein [Sulfurimonas autotrophica]ADN09430.1 hypothetical protein Saut_1383 [Sulfurimonas autotrophica DSM 16294]
MPDILEYIKSNKGELFETILNDISEYKYRNARYDVEFSLVAIYCKNTFAVDVETLKKKLRQTDRLIYLNDNLCCIILDGISAELCAKAAENVNYHLLQINVNNKYYLSAADSQNYNPKYKNMIQSLLDRLEYAIENNLENIVIYQDYVI